MLRLKLLELSGSIFVLFFFTLVRAFFDEVCRWFGRRKQHACSDAHNTELPVAEIPRYHK